MKRSTKSWIALGAAMELVYAASTLGANPGATQSLRDAAVTQAFGDIDPMTDNVPVGSNGVAFPAPYCTVSYAQAVHPVTRVHGMGIDNVSDPIPDASPSFEDFTAVVGQVETGELVDISVRGNTTVGSTEGVKVYIDWNQDGSFDDASEGYLIGYLASSTGTDGKQVTAAIRVPISARTGETRMRVIKALDLMANPWSCNEGGSGWGQAEDYTLYVGGLQSEAIFCSSFEKGEDGSCSTLPAADIVYSGPLNVAIPPTDIGLRINFVTGEVSSTVTSDYDFLAYRGNVFANGDDLWFFWGYGGTSANNAGVALTELGPYLVLGSGDMIGPSSTFARGSDNRNTEMVKFWVGINGYLGIKFMNEQTGEINYGYVHMLTTAGNGFPSMILDYA